MNFNSFEGPKVHWISIKFWDAWGFLLVKHVPLQSDVDGSIHHRNISVYPHFWTLTWFACKTSSWFLPYKVDLNTSWLRKHHETSRGCRLFSGVQTVLRSARGWVQMVPAFWVRQNTFGIFIHLQISEGDSKFLLSFVDVVVVDCIITYHLSLLNFHWLLYCRFYSSAPSIWLDMIIHVLVYQLRWRDVFHRKLCFVTLVKRGVFVEETKWLVRWNDQWNKSHLNVFFPGNDELMFLPGMSLK